MEHKNQGSDNGRTCTCGTVPVDPLTCTMHAPDPVPGQTPAQYSQPDARNCTAGRISVPERSTESIRAEAHYQDWASVPFSERPLAATRSKHAAALDAARRARSVSIERLADMIGVTKRRAGKYLKGDVPIPTTILDALPVEIRADFLERVAGRPSLSREVDRLDRQSLVDVRNRILARLDGLAAEGK